MANHDYYAGREQTLLKHYFLENYLETVAYHIAWSWGEFVFVDGFSGPWETKGQNFEDTSFKIAIRILRKVKERLKSLGKDINVKCLFIEDKRKNYLLLEHEISQASDITVKAINSKFIEAIPEIKTFIGNSFAFLFIDPKGWTGFELEEIKPLITNKGEVLINFMYKHISRFINVPMWEDSFSKLFGSNNWSAKKWENFQELWSDEEALLLVYLERLKEVGNFKFTTYTPILKPSTDKTFFHLVYGTRHIKGLIEFRKVEERFFVEQGYVRNKARQKRGLEGVGQTSFLTLEESFGGSEALLQFRDRRLTLANETFENLIKKYEAISFGEVLEIILENPFVWEKDVVDWVVEMKKEGRIEVLGMGSRERRPKNHHIIKSIKPL